jgi:hypothetical protein
MSAKQDDGVKWEWADIREMPQYANKSIDVAFDKGTMDAMIHGSPWSPPDDVKDNTSRYLAEVSAFCGQGTSLERLTKKTLGTSCVEG